MMLELQEATALLNWYNSNHRDLPWRDTGDAYDVWISEIMLQQTRVEFVKERFLRFKEVLPDIAALAQCEEDVLMKLWEGMGYYNRARNLKKCAQVLCECYNGTLPETYAELIALPGIGPYTAGAISSIAYNHPVSAVDGNVMRILARKTADARDIRETSLKTEYSNAVQQFYDTNYEQLKQSCPRLPSLLNQALMELGALVCVPNGAPHCQECPWANCCKAYLTDSTDRIPYRSPLKQRVIQNRTILVIRDGDRFLLHKRPQGGLLGGLYEFPGVDTFLGKQEALHTVEQLGLTPVRIHVLPESKHIFSHIEWHMHAFEVQVTNIETLEQEDFLLLSKKELQKFAVPSAFHTYKEYYSL